MGGMKTPKEILEEKRVHFELNNPHYNDAVSIGINCMWPDQSSFIYKVFQMAAHLGLTYAYNTNCDEALKYVKECEGTFFPKDSQK